MATRTKPRGRLTVVRAAKRCAVAAVTAVSLFVPSARRASGCTDKGLVQGYDEPAGKFLRPGEKVARERVAVVLARAFDMGILR